MRAILSVTTISQGQSPHPNEPLHLDHRHVFHIPTADNIRPARFHARGTPAHRGNRSHLGTRPTIRFYPSQHSRFELTGSFFNPGPYSGFLVAILPLALYYTLTACRIARILSGVILVLLLLVLPATLSRGAWLAAIAGCGIVLGNYFHLYNRLKFLFQKHRLASFIATICIFLLVTGTLIGIYQLKKNLPMDADSSGKSRPPS